MYQFDGWSETFQNHMEDKKQNNSTMETVLFIFFSKMCSVKKIKFLCYNLFNVQFDQPMIY